MKVYIAEIGWDYEGSEILGVFTTRERAEKELEIRRTFTSKNMVFKRGDWAAVTEMEVEE